MTAAARATDFTPTELKSAEILQARALASPEAYEIVESLTTDVGPRPAGSPGDRAAIAWALAMLRDRGFSNIHVQDVTVPHWVRGNADVAVTAPVAQPLVAVSLGGSVGIEGDGINGEAVLVTSLEDLAARSEATIRGRIVVISQRTDRTRDGSGYDRVSDVRRKGAVAAAARGASAVVIRSIGTDADRFAHTGSMRYDPNLPRIPAFAVSNPDADMLERLFASGKPVRLHLRSSAQPMETERSGNVIAEVRGTDLAEEIVLLAAHLDSWDLGVGALDDGAGVAIVMTAANLLRTIEPRPRRTIRVVLYANEEFGLSGGEAYARESSDLARHVLAMGADSGAGPVWRLDSGVPKRLEGFVDRLQGAIHGLGVVVGANEDHGVPDIEPLWKSGVPTLSPVLDVSRYFDVHHTANDTLAQVDAAALRQSVAVFAVCAYLAAMTPDLTLPSTTATAQKGATSR